MNFKERWIGVLLLSTLFYSSSCAQQKSSEALGDVEKIPEGVYAVERGIMKPAKEAYLIQLKLNVPIEAGNPIFINAQGNKKGEEAKPLSLSDTSSKYFTVPQTSPLQVSKKANVTGSTIETYLNVPYSIVKRGNVEMKITLDFLVGTEKAKTTITKDIWIPAMPPVYDPNNPRKKIL